MLAADGATRGKSRGITGRAAYHWMIGDVEVQLMPSKHHLLSSGTETGEADATPTTENFMLIPR
jgi:hypothetical protein